VADNSLFSSNSVGRQTTFTANTPSTNVVAKSDSDKAVATKSVTEADNKASAAVYAKNASDSAHKEAPDTVDAAAAKLENYMQSISRDLQFKVDNQSGDVIVTVLDPSTNEVIRQIPGEDAIALSKRVEELGLKLLDRIA